MIHHKRRAFLTSVATVLGTSALAERPLSAAGPDGSARPEPFKVRVPQATLDDVKWRLKAAHYPKLSQGAGARYGLDAGAFKALVDYWQTRYDFRAAEAELNATPQFIAKIRGKKLHFARLEPKSRGASLPPLLLLHGWPYTFATMLPLAHRLRGQGFEVIVPSLPGVAFSEAPDVHVRGLRFISRYIDELMTVALGHARYVVHGGDHGAVVADWLALDTPSHVLGIHANMIAFRHAGASYGSGQTGVSDATPEEVAFVRAEVENMERESAYFRLQLTRPETITYALSDSPLGWAAYMLDKWQKWTDERERSFEAIYGRERLITEVMLFLVTDSVATAMWPYAGFATEPFGLEPRQRIGVPFGYSSFPDPLSPRVPRHFVERSRTDIRFWREHDKGGHFPMLEQSEALAADLSDFVARLR
jgi:pimeloyl-ACP methyl ester carboxylesterase